MRKYHQFKIDFIKNKKIYFTISLGIILIGLLVNIFFGTEMDIQFTGGAIVDYTYSGQEIDADSLASIVKDATGLDAEVTLSSNIVSGNSGLASNSASVEFAGNDALTLDQQDEVTNAFAENYPDSNFTLSQSTSVDPTNGQSFFWKCMCAIALASILMVIYIAFRFRKIGGWSAGVMAIVSLLHDVAIIYFTFVIFRMPIDDNFVAVVLTILGYSLNDTIIIYDRIRENKKLLGEKKEIGDLVNLSINQTLQRTINTTLTTALAITSVLVVSLIFNVDSVVTFALPMLVGIISGCYSTICIAGPLWVMWQHRKQRKVAELQRGSKKDKAREAKLAAESLNSNSIVDESLNNISVDTVKTEPSIQLDLSKRGSGKAKLSKKDRDKLKDQNK